MKKTCKETVWGERVQSWKCQRSAGYGPNGDYCKQHARRHEKKEATVTLWDLEIKYGDGIPKPIKAREVTPSTYIDETGRRLGRKTEYHLIFDSEEEAIQCSLTRTRNALKRAKAEVAENEALIEKLEKRSSSTRSPSK